MLRARARTRALSVPHAGVGRVTVESMRPAHDRLLKVAEVAERLAVGRDWVYRRIETGEIPVVELGDTRKNQRIRESDLALFIDARTYGAGLN